MRFISILTSIFFTLTSCSCLHVKVPDSDNEGQTYNMRIDTYEDIWVVHLDGTVNAASMDALVKSLDMADENADVRLVLVEINSKGGDVDEGIKGAKALERANTPIACLVDGEADSMAFYLLQSCPLRMMTKRSTVMVHNPVVVLRERWTANWRELKVWSNRFKAYERGMSEHYTHRMTTSAAELEQIFVEHNGEWWMNWPEAEQKHAVDKVVDNLSEALDVFQIWMPRTDAGTPDAGP